MGMNGEIAIEPHDRDMLLALLNRFLPGVEVWAHGSRVKGHARSASDLDLVAFTTDERGSQVTALREALDESRLPFRVDLAVWDDVPERFRANILETHMVLLPRER
jgi:predicted nucleotidyltransferase